MRDDLMKRIAPWCWETGVINLDDSSGVGTHWVAYVKKDEDCEYFDSYGNLRPPQEFIDYISKGVSNISIKYNYNNVQNKNSYNCGHLCLRFLLNVCNYIFTK